MKLSSSRTAMHGARAKRPVPRGPLAALVLCAFVAVAAGQGPLCLGQDPVGGVPPATHWPTDVTEVVVDPRGGDDLQAARGVPGVAFRTIRVAALSLLGQTALDPNRHGVVRLLPGFYGPSSNGERFPIPVPARVSIVGVDAATVVIRADEPFASIPELAIPLPALDAPGMVPARAAFVFGYPQQSGFEHTALARMTIVGADVGVIITGNGEVSPGIVECSFLACRVGVQIHGLQGGPSGRHRPLLLWNTFGDGVYGVVDSGEVRGFPAIVNCVIASATAFEGIACNAVVASAFDRNGINRSSFIAQPVASPVPEVDLAAFDRRDLFLGARMQPFARPLEWFSDWRPTYLTVSGAPNPLLSLGRSDFPFAAPNGTWARLPFPRLPLGTTSSEGPGTSGGLPTPPPTPGTGTGGAHIGYRNGGSFLIGGTLPGEKRFGTGASGIYRNQVHIYFPPQLTPVDLFGAIVQAPAWPVTSGGPLALAPVGMLATPTMTAEGPLYLDPSEPRYDFRSYLSQLTTRLESNPLVIYNQAIVTVPTSFAPETTFVLQALAFDPLRGYVLTDAQYFQIP